MSFGIQFPPTAAPPSPYPLLVGTITSASNVNNNDFTFGDDLAGAILEPDATYFMTYTIRLDQVVTPILNIDYSTQVQVSTDAFPNPYSGIGTNGIINIYEDPSFVLISVSGILYNGFNTAQALAGTLFLSSGSVKSAEYIGVTLRRLT